MRKAWIQFSRRDGHKVFLAKQNQWKSPEAFLLLISTLYENQSNSSFIVQFHINSDNWICYKTYQPPIHLWKSMNAYCVTASVFKESWNQLYQNNTCEVTGRGVVVYPDCSYQNKFRQNSGRQTAEIKVCSVHFVLNVSGKALALRLVCMPLGLMLFWKNALITKLDLI